MRDNTITILCSGVALGVYIPAILTEYQLRSEGLDTEVVVLEDLLPKDKKNKVLENKKAFHQSFRVALTGQKMARDLWPILDQNAVDALFKKWKSEKRLDFIVFSGFWMSVLKEYALRSGFKYQELNIDIIHMDAVISASWRNYQTESQLFNNVWLFNWTEKRLTYELPISQVTPKAYHERQERFVIHGGGWGMGTYQSKIPELEENGIPLDIIAYDVSETTKPKQGNRYFMIDPVWSPWQRNKENRHEFPPFGEVVPGSTPIFRNKPEYHELFDLISSSKGIISKPGGATLLDSLSSATPIIMLEPFGDYEEKNADLWEALGFGIRYNDWRQTGYSREVLTQLHENLLRTKGTLINLTKDYVRKKIS